MTRRWAAFGLLGVSLLAPRPAAAQLGFGFRAGTLGFGLEAAVDLSSRVVGRGGVGLTVLEAGTSFDGVPVRLELPDLWFAFGADYYLNSEFRVGAGMLLKPSDPVLTGLIEESVDIGGRTLTPSELGTLTGTIDMDDQAVYALIGFGRHTAAGVGVFVDAGATVFRSPAVSLAAEGGSLSADELEPLLEAESRSFEDDMKTYLRVWPILSIGLRIGVGG